MDWRSARQAALRRNIDKFDSSEASTYYHLHGMGRLDVRDREAYLSDLRELIDLDAGPSVLDVGAGTGAMCKVLAQIPEIRLTALEPSPAMLDVLKQDAALSSVRAVEGTTDQPGDADRFSEATFDVIVTRQVVNSLFDPLVAFRHWRKWLRGEGTLIVIEGLYGRDAWRGKWSEEVDELPLSATQSRATIPYLLESVGFRIRRVEWMKATNERPCTKTPRYAVHATKNAS